jgi:hypothetical protein
MLARQLIEQGRIGEVYHYGLSICRAGAEIREIRRHGDSIPKRQDPE